jgi:hypothetical protein
LDRPAKSPMADRKPAYSNNSIRNYFLSVPVTHGYGTDSNGGDSVA